MSKEQFHLLSKSLNSLLQRIYKLQQYSADITEDLNSEDISQRTRKALNNAMRINTALIKQKSEAVQLVLPEITLYLQSIL